MRTTSGRKPDHCWPTLPRLRGLRLTANPQLRPVIAERRTPEENDASSPRRSRPRARLTNRSLTPPVAASTHVEARLAERASRSSLFPGRASAKVRTVILELARAVPPALASTSAASSARGAFHRRVLLVRGARHPFASFAAARWASGPRSPLSLARGEARPEVRTPVVHLRRAEGPRAARRLLQSKRPASTTERAARTLLTRREVALAPSSSCRWPVREDGRFRSASPA